MTELIQIQTPETGSAAAKRFFNELLENVETLTGIALEHGARTLADILYLQNAILDDSFIELYPDESAVLAVVDELPSAATWKKYIRVITEDGLPVAGESALLRDAKQLVSDIEAQMPPTVAVLRDDVPNEILEMLLFEGAPQGRSRTVIEERFSMAATIPYIARWLGKPESTPEADQANERIVTNHYLCSCGEMWQGEWSSACNELCDTCNREAEPYASNDGSMADAEITQSLKRVADMRQYLIANEPNAWPHLFAGFGEYAVRFVFDRKANAIVAMQLFAPGSNTWRDATQEQIAEVQDSLITANVEAIADPFGSGYGLTAADHLPFWARA